MSSAVFYGITSEFWQVACKVTEKMYDLGERTLFLCDDDSDVIFCHSKLWTFSKLAFIPSGSKSTVLVDDAKFCSVWFSTKVEFCNAPTCLLHNGLDVSRLDGIDKFDKVVDIFDIGLIEAARTRAGFYAESSFENSKMWLQEDGSWRSGSLV
ncbi:MAG: DNA polymerase III subunit chi [Holosporales bacterium]|jgi:DNA polymerase IIIc chi subunit|nr:DNA polymerase III subunit chi [Holosporales bacterium]